jgi:hypothetical protein
MVRAPRSTLSPRAAGICRRARPGSTGTGPHPQRAHRHPPRTARPDEDQRLTTPGMLTIDRRTARSDVPRRLTPSPRNTSPTGPARSDGDDRAGCGQHGQLRQGGPNPGVHQHRQPAQRGQPDQPGLRGHPRCMADPGEEGAARPTRPAR